MKKKLLSNTYLKGVSKYQIKILYEDDFYLCIKKVEEIDKPFIISTGLCLIDNNYYMIELLPKKEHYSIRAYFNQEKELLQYYIDISKENALDIETHIPYYDDLYIDIIITGKEIEVVDEDELELALKENRITKEDYELAYLIKDKLLEEIKSNKNKYLKMNLGEYLYDL